MIRDECFKMSNLTEESNTELIAAKKVLLSRNPKASKTGNDRIFLQETRTKKRKL